MSCSVSSTLGSGGGTKGGKDITYGGDVEGMIGDGLRSTYSWIASRAHVSILLNAYLFDTRAMAMS